jgi:pSer/pThr/pTyr-binding forkhead associated (FHA) protein
MTRAGPVSWYKPGVGSGEGAKLVLRWRGEAYALDPGKELIIGRSHGCHFVVDDPSVSRKHALVRREDDGVIVQDLGSSNGTFVDGARIAGRSPILPGAMVGIGPEAIEVGIALPDEVVVRVATAISLSSATGEGSGTRDDTTLTGIERTDHMLDGCELLARGGKWREAAAALLSALPTVIEGVERRPGSGPEALRRSSRCFAAVAEKGHGSALVEPILRLHELLGAVPDEATIQAVRAAGGHDVATQAAVRRFVERARSRRLSATDLKRLDRIEDRRDGAR